MKIILLNWLKRLLLLGFAGFVLYLAYLNHLVKSEFSKPLGRNHSALPVHSYPKPLVNMLLLVEDQSFFDHIGIDFKEIAKVFRDNVLLDKPMRGASTLTQQLIKNTLLTQEKTLKRKANEALMALSLEWSFSKDFILRRYMNTVYLGQSGNRAIYGFAKAAQFYFNQPVHQLSLKQMATLVALVKGPSYYHPIRQKQRLDKRAALVLRLYHKYEKIIK